MRNRRNVSPQLETMESLTLLSGAAASALALATHAEVAATTAGKDPAQPVKIKSATADFSQQGYPIAHAIDGNPGTGWAVYPEMGKPHAAVFLFDAPIAGPAGQLTITLDFQFGQSHQFGRFRLSVADAADPLYKTLDDGQKRRLSFLTHREGRFGAEGWRHRWLERGMDRDDRGHDRDGRGERL